MSPPSELVFVSAPRVSRYERGVPAEILDPRGRCSRRPARRAHMTSIARAAFPERFVFPVLVAHIFMEPRWLVYAVFSIYVCDDKQKAVHIQKQVLQNSKKRQTIKVTGCMSQHERNRSV